MSGSARISRPFFVVWSGQLVSLVGSSLTGFALAVWVFREASHQPLVVGRRRGYHVGS